MKYDAIIILSGGVGLDGTIPDNTKARIRKAVELFHTCIAPVLAMTGKWGYSINYQPPITEARAMTAYAHELGIPESALVMEEESTDTLGNAYFVKIRLAQPLHWNRIIIVTSDYHVSRSEYLFKKVFGSAFDISCIAAPSDLTGKKRLDKDAREQRSLALAHQWLDPITDGDDTAVWHLMTTKHPGYSQNPEFTKEQLEKALGPQ